MNLAHLHLVLNHFPVLGSLFAMVLLGAGFYLKSRDLEKASYVALIASALFAIATFLTGEPAEEYVEHMPGVSEDWIHPHEEAAEFAMWISIATGLLASAALTINFKKGSTSNAVKIGVALGTLVTVGAMGNAARLGGLVRHTELREGTPPVEGIDSKKSNDSGEKESHDD